MRHAVRILAPSLIELNNLQFYLFVSVYHNLVRKIGAVGAAMLQ
jgi:hypothetical protein